VYLSEQTIVTLTDYILKLLKEEGKDYISSQVLEEKTIDISILGKYVPKDRKLRLWISIQI
jgi:hypothetical protein